MNKKLLTEFKNRGYFFQCTNENYLEKLIESKKISFYIGFDCTASSLHVGSLIQIMCLRLFQKFGHKPIVLLGGGTTMVGDPSGKEESRKILTEEQIEKNIQQIKGIFSKFLDRENMEKVVYVNNKKWLTKLNYIYFLRTYGKHFTLNRMLTFDSVKTRLEREQSLSFLEFNYMILQAYDYLELFKNNDCFLQIGGSDQWGNIVNGVDLIRKEIQGEAMGLTTPLITTAQGKKMGKTEDGAVWLNEDLCSPYDYWQFWRNTDDRDVLKFIKIFTNLEVDEIDKIKNTEINELKILLANNATKMLHGEGEEKKCEASSKETFYNNCLGDTLQSVSISKKQLDEKINTVELIILSKLENSKSEARRLIKGNGVKINSQIIDDEKMIVTKKLFNIANTPLLLSSLKVDKIEK